MAGQPPAGPPCSGQVLVERGSLDLVGGLTHELVGGHVGGRVAVDLIDRVEDSLSPSSVSAYASSALMRSCTKLSGRSGVTPMPSDGISGDSANTTTLLKLGQSFGLTISRASSNDTPTSASPLQTASTELSWPIDMIGVRSVSGIEAGIDELERREDEARGRASVGVGDRRARFDLGDGVLSLGSKGVALVGLGLVGAVAVQQRVRLSVRVGVLVSNRRRRHSTCLGCW